MRPYRDLHGDSGIAAYEAGRTWIRIRFKQGGTYLYDHVAPGALHVARMVALARSGDGLNTYINRHVRDRYAEKVA